MGHSIVDFYRETYNLPFSNGIIFTTESSKKSDNFLFNKITNHIEKWKMTKEILILGNLESYRNIIHPLDVAHAISSIIEQKNGNNYLICNTDKNHRIYDLVIKLYEKAGINLIDDNNILYDKTSGEIVIKIENLQHIENKIINIEGYPENLLKIGWLPKHDIDDIFSELINKTKL
jgi:GDP-D-mannose dehydratase